MTLNSQVPNRQTHSWKRSNLTSDPMFLSPTLQLPSQKPTNQILYSDKYAGCFHKS